jgi:hypothetical protein
MIIINSLLSPLKYVVEMLLKQSPVSGILVHYNSYPVTIWQKTTNNKSQKSNNIQIQNINVQK